MLIPESEVCELLLQIHGILDKAVSKQVGNSACILAHLFNCFQAASGGLGFTVSFSPQS